MRRLLWPLLLGLLACSPQGAPAAGAAPQAPSLPVALELPPDLAPLPEGVADPGLSLLLERLAPKAGQRLLLLGSGGAWLGAPLARALGPEGRVLYLADNRFDEPQTNAQAKALGLANLEARYYPEQATLAPGAGFDLLLLLDFASEDLASPKTAARLASWLLSGGRLVLVQPIPYPDFQARSRWSETQAFLTLCAQGPTFPLLAPLAEAGLVVDCRQPRPPEGFGPRFLATLNAHLEDPALYRDLNRHLNLRRGVASEAARFVEEDGRVRVLQWVDGHLGHLLGAPGVQLDQRQRELLRAANHILLSGLFAIEAGHRDRFSRRLPLQGPQTLEAAFGGAGLTLLRSERPFASHLWLEFGTAQAAGGPRP